MSDSRIDRSEVFTTGRIARIARLSPQTVAKAFDAGLLRGFRIPGSPMRRSTRAQVGRFLREHGLPFDLDTGAYVEPDQGTTTHLSPSIHAEVTRV